MRTTTFVAVASLIACSSAHAALTDTIAQVYASASELDEAGYTRVGTGPFISGPSGECSVNGCFDLVGANGALPLKGYFQFQFNNYQYNPLHYSGLFAILDVNFSGSPVSLGSFINQVNAQSSSTGITALTTFEASDAQESSFFNEWLPNQLDGGIVFKWMPASPPTGGGLSEVFTFAWDLTDVAPPGYDNGLTLNGVYGVPTPGAMALLAAAGLVGRRRR